MSVSNLTGTTWLINSTIVEPSSTIYAEINFASNADTFSRIAIYDGFEPGTEQLIMYSPQGQESSIIAYEYGWSNEAYRTIEIAGGTDVTNSTLIGWLEDNARQIVDDVAIKYQGNTIATMTASGTKTLLTADSYCENNITIEYTKPSANLQAKTNISPTTSSQTIVADNGYDGLSSVTVNAISPIKAAQTYTPSTQNQTIASGQYLTGTQTILGDANLLAENIKKDVSIFGVTGTFEGGGSVQTATVTLAKGYSGNIYYTDENLTMQTVTSGSLTGVTAVVGTLVVALGTPEPTPIPTPDIGVTLVASNTRGAYYIYKVTG